MNIEPSVPTTKNPSAHFAGDVRLDPTALPPRKPPDHRCRHSPFRSRSTCCLALPRTRPVCPRHAGRGPSRYSGRQIIEVHPSQTLYTPPGEEHWHSAAPAASLNKQSQSFTTAPTSSFTMYRTLVTITDKAFTASIECAHIAFQYRGNFETATRAVRPCFARHWLHGTSQLTDRWNARGQSRRFC